MGLQCALLQVPGHLSHPGGETDTEGYCSSWANRALATHLTAHSLPFPGLSNPVELLTACHPLCSAECLNSLPKEGMDQSFPVSGPLSRRTRTDEGSPICLSFLHPLSQPGLPERQQTLTTGHGQAGRQAGDFLSLRGGHHASCFRNHFSHMWDAWVAQQLSFCLQPRV